METKTEDNDLFAPRTKKPKAPKVEEPKPVAVAVPPVVDYVPAEGGRWRVELFEALAAELPVMDMGPDAATSARRFHELVSQANARWWTLVRRLYGMAPLVPPSGADLDDLRVWGRAELCAALGIEAKQLQAELDTLRGVMRGKEEVRGGELRVEGKEGEIAADGEGHLLLDEDLLERYGYTVTMFNIRQRTETIEMVDDKEVHRYAWTDRNPLLNRMEQAWFVGRLREWKRVLDEPMTGSLAKQALFNELQMRRVEAEMANLSPTAGGYDDLAKRHAAYVKTFGDLVEKLEAAFPEFGSSAKKINFKACIHDLVKAHMDYKLRGDTRLLDRVRTALEIEVDFRQSVQAPEARYRLGQTVFIGEAIAGLMDPAWKSQLKPGVLAKLDRGMKEGINKAREERGETLTDLEAAGEAGEYAGLEGAGS